MELAIKEVKTQAKKLLKALRKNNSEILISQAKLKKLALTSAEQLQLKHCLTIVAIELGFENWHQLQKILSGSESTDEIVNMGTFFYPKICGGFINEWFVDYQEARKTIANYDGVKWLLPYKNQFIVVKEAYISTFKLSDNTMQLWPRLQYDLVSSYNSVAWDEIVFEIIKNRSKAY